MNKILKTSLPSTPKFQSLQSLLKVGSQALLLDCSHSMDISDDEELRRIDRLRNVAEKFKGSIRQFIFQKSECYEMEEIPEPAGGTPMAFAFQILKGNGVTHVILITDGQPNSMERALEESTGLVIDVFFVGDPNDYFAIEFLKKLTSRANGKFGETTFTKGGEKYLENEILLLIESETESPQIINL